MLEVKATGQHGRMDTGSCRNGRGILFRRHLAVLCYGCGLRLRSGLGHETCGGQMSYIQDSAATTTTSSSALRGRHQQRPH